MNSPFPGMDPYIEACGMWKDFHHDLIAAIKADLAARVPPRYLVRTGERAYIALIEPERGREEFLFKPDVGIVGVATGTAGAGATATLPLALAEDEALTLRALVQEEFHESFVEISTDEPERRLITCIEVLSPSNKRKNTHGWDQYLRKRQALLMGVASLVELDLLRGGERMPMADPLPDSPYYLLVGRKTRAPYCQVYQAHYRRRLRPVPVPLEAPDPDVSLDLQPMIEAIYARSRYHRDIDYSKPLAPPLPAEDDAWLREATQNSSRQGRG